MSEPQRWISRHPVIAYFALAYLLSWPLFLLVLLVFPRNMALQGTAGTLAVFAPALAGMISGGVGEPARVEPRRGALWVTFAATWILAWATLVLFAREARGAPAGPPVIAFGAFLGLLPAFVASRAFSRIAGIRRHFHSLVRPRGSLFWYLFALLIFPVIQLAGWGLTRLFGGEGGHPQEFHLALDPLRTALIFLHGFFFAGGINEESGWRGFALPRLQERYCPLVAGLIVWFFWALWHLPVDLSSGQPASSILLNRVLFNVMWSILFLWVFNRTKGSLLAPALFHPAMNTFGDLLPRTGAATVLFAALVVTAIVSDRMWRRLPDSILLTRR